MSLHLNRETINNSMSGNFYTSSAGRCGISDTVSQMPAAATQCLKYPLLNVLYVAKKRFAREFGKSLINSAWKCGKAFCLCRTFWERVKVQVMEGSHVRKKYFGHWLINPYPPLTALLSKGSLFTDLATCRDLHWVVEIPLKGAFINAPYTL